MSGDRSLPTWADGYISDAKASRPVPHLGRQVVRYLRHGISPGGRHHGRRRGVEGSPKTLPRNMDPYGWLDVVALSWAMECSVGEALRCLLSDRGRFALAIRSTPVCPGGHFFTRANRRHTLDIIPDHMPEETHMHSDVIEDGRTRRKPHHRDYHNKRRHR